jgi:hypothetical protein
VGALDDFRNWLMVALAASWSIDRPLVDTRRLQRHNRRAARGTATHRSGSGDVNLDAQHRSSPVNQLALKHREIERPLNRFRRRRSWRSS